MKRDPADAPEPLSRRISPYAWALLGGVFAFLGFAGFGIWPLAFVAFIPLFAASDLVRLRGTRSVLGVATLFAVVSNAGGYYWLTSALSRFSGFPLWACLIVAGVLILYNAGSFVVTFWLWSRATDRGWNLTLAAVASTLACELFYPRFLPFHYGASLHALPVVLQVVDLGGPLLLTALVIVVNAALYEVGRSLAARSRPLPWRAPAVAACYVAFVLAYGAYRMHEVDARVSAAPKVLVGVVQANVGVVENAEEANAGHARHVQQSLELQSAAQPDLIVWPETSFRFFIGDGTSDARNVLGDVTTPLLFGGISLGQTDADARQSNTAFITDSGGTIRGTYDKMRLIAFSEYIPFGEIFPGLYRISTGSKRFAPGSHADPLPFREYRIATLICYEDILPAFVRTAMQSDPELIVNLTNDAWFGDTHEPWIHFALAKLRAVEHHRYLVRATNSGVSGVVDPVGRVVTHSGTFVRANLHAEVAMLGGRSIYQSLGDWPGWLSVALIGWMAFLRRPRRLDQPLCRS